MQGQAHYAHFANGFDGSYIFFVEDSKASIRFAGRLNGEGREAGWETLELLANQSVKS